MGNGTNTQTLHLLQIYRGFAAISVVCFHATTNMSAVFGVDGFGGFFLWGFSGVPVFFVLSGFIICFIHFSDIGIPQKAGRYLYKRSVRIYPVYWLTLLFYLAALLYGQKTPTLSSLIDNITLLRILIDNITLLRITNFEKIVLVAWTLSHEILFYLVFLILILHRVTGVILISIWSFMMLYNYSTGDILMPPYALSSLTGIDYGVFTNFQRLVSSPINALFALGALSFLSYRMINAHPRAEYIKISSLLAGIFIFIAASVYWLNEENHENWWSYNAVFGIAAFFLFVASGSARVETWAANQRIPLLLGGASYSIYLIHFGLQKLLISFLESSTIINPNVYFIVLIVVPIFLGILSYRYVESPLMNLFGRGRMRSSITIAK